MKEIIFLKKGHFLKIVSTFTTTNLKSKTTFSALFLQSRRQILENLKGESPMNYCVGYSYFWKVGNSVITFLAVISLITALPVNKMLWGTHPLPKMKSYLQLN